MRMIGSLPDETAAQKFSDYLLTLGMDAHVEESSQGHAIWVEHDDHLERARTELTAFLANPADQRYDAAPTSAGALRKERDRQAERRRRNFTDVRTSWAQAAGNPTPVTVALIVLCVVIGIATSLGAKESSVEPLLIVPIVRYIGDHHVEWGTLHDTIGRHQYWRFISPILVHSGILHLLFNMSMLLNFGGQIERHKGTLILVLLILATAIPSNLAQYWQGTFAFGGMSGVIYALFGFIWMKSRLEPHEKLAVDQSTVYFLLGWLVLCMTLLDNIANTAHVVGLACGLLLGAAPFYIRRLRRSLG